MTEPFDIPEQETLLITALLDIGAAGWVTVVVPVAVQPLASVTVTVYVPALSPAAVEVVAPPVLHEYV
jgi:hypothetical protein